MALLYCDYLFAENTTFKNVPAPVGTKSGDTVIVGLIFNNRSKSITPPAGFSLHSANPWAFFNFTTYVYISHLTSTPPGSWQFSWSGTEEYVDMFHAVYTGRTGVVGSTNFVDNQTGDNSINLGNPTVVEGTDAFAWGIDTSYQGLTYTPASWVNHSTYPDFPILTGVDIPAGPTGAITFTRSGGSGRIVGQYITFPPSEDTPPPDPPGEGSGNQSFSFNVGGTGKTQRKGLGPHAYSFALSGAGQSSRQGAGSLTYEFDQSGTGQAPEIPAASGTGTLSYAFSLSASGKTIRRGGGSPTYSFELSGTGQTTRSGSSSEALVRFDTSGLGRKEPFGSGNQGFSASQIGLGRSIRRSGGFSAYSWVTVGTGESKPLGGGSLSHIWSLSGTGKASKQGSGSQTHRWSISGSGGNKQGGLGSLSYLFHQDGTGETSRFGLSGHSYRFDQNGTGETDRSGPGQLSYIFNLSGSGQAPLEEYAGEGSLAYGFNQQGSGQTSTRGWGSLRYLFELSGAGQASHSGFGSQLYHFELTGRGWIFAPAVIPDTLTLEIKTATLYLRFEIDHLSLDLRTKPLELEVVL